MTATDDSLVDACRRGDSEVVRELLEDGASPSPEALCVAIKHSVSTECINQLLECGVPVDSVGPMSPSQYGRDTPLRLAMASVLERPTDGHRIEVARLLLRWGADPDIHLRPGVTLLIMCISCREAVELLLGYGASPNMADASGRESPLRAAARGDDPSIVAMLLDRGADPNDVSKVPDSCLCAAARSGKIEIAKLLIDSGADVNLKSRGGVDALNSACMWGQWEMADMLISHGASPFGVLDFIDGWQRPGEGRTKCVQVLARHGAPVARALPLQLRGVMREVRKGMAMALCLGSHSRVGSDSPLKSVDSEVIQLIAKALFP